MRRLLRAIQYLVGNEPERRRRVYLEIVQRFANIFGDFPLGEDLKIWRHDRQFLANYTRLSPGNRFSEERKYLLREFVRFVSNVEGCLAECGSYEGASAWFMANELPGESFYIFDSFDGLSPPETEDKLSGGGCFWQVGDMRAPETAIARNLSEFRNIYFMKGWIPERFPEVAEKAFRFVHIDVDLYSPTLESISFFYPRMSRGGVILLDDYGFLSCPGATKAVDEFMLDKPERVLNMPTGQGLIIIGSGGLR